MPQMQWHGSFFNHVQKQEATEAIEKEYDDDRQSRYRKEYNDDR